MIGFDLNDVSNINIGNITIGSVYIGNTKIWENGPAPHDYEQDYFTTVAKGSGDITFRMLSNVDTSLYTSISYSTDNGNTWTTVRNFSGQTISATVSVNDGDKVLWKGEGKTLTNDDYQENIIDSTMNCDVEGNIMSLLNGDNFYHSSLDTSYIRQFFGLFYENSHLISAENLVLPVTTLTDHCYWRMFENCTSLTTTPQILPATTLIYGCYQDMFSGCSSITTGPEIAATTLAESCCTAMFSGCSSLTTAPALLAKTLVYNCYFYLFNNCRSLNYIKMMATDNIGSLDYWHSGLPSTGTFVKDANATLSTGTSGIPDGWNVINE